MWRQFLISIVLCWLALCQISQAQPLDTLWSYYLGSTSGHCTYQTVDRGFITIGNLAFRILLVKNDALGKMQWNYGYGAYTYGLHGDDVQETVDNGFIMIGGSEGGITDIMLIKTDSLGIVQWTNYLSGSLNYSHGYSVRQTKDCGFIITGYTLTPQYPQAIQQLLLIKTNPSGAVLWTRQYTQALKGIRVLQSDDGGYVIGGIGSEFQTYLMKTDSLGYLIWDHQYTGGGVRDLIENKSGGYVIAAQYNVIPLLIKTDELGNQIWSSMLPPLYLGGVRQSSDGGYLVAGHASQGYLLKTDTNGNLIWSISLSMGIDEVSISSIDLCRDGGCVLCGFFNAINPWPVDLLLVRFAGPLRVSAAPAFAPVILPHSGGSFDYTLNLFNTSDDSLSHATVWIDLTLPDSSHMDTTIIVSDISMAPYNTLTWQLSQYIGYEMPDGVYQFNAYAGEYPINTGITANFTFEKQPELGTKSKQSSISDFQFSRFPNPFNSTTNLHYFLPHNEHVRLTVFDCAGNRVSELVNTQMIAGAHQIIFNGLGLPSGLYITRFEAGPYRSTQKLVLLK